MTATSNETSRKEPFPKHLVDKATAESHPLSIWFNLSEEALNTLPERLRGKIDRHKDGLYAGILSAEDIVTLHKAGATKMCHSRAGIPRPPKD